MLNVVTICSFKGNFKVYMVIFCIFFIFRKIRENLNQQWIDPKRSFACEACLALFLCAIELHYCPETNKNTPESTALLVTL